MTIPGIFDKALMVPMKADETKAEPIIQDGKRKVWVNLYHIQMRLI
jgi:hypothetical protein